MSIQAKAGSFQVLSTDTVGTTIAVTGLGFTPKAIIFYWSGNPSSSDNAQRADTKPGIGYATGAASRVCCVYGGRDNVGTSDVHKGSRSDACMMAGLFPDALDGLLDLQSLDADGFTIIVDDQFAATYRVHYLALGGDSITNATTGNFQLVSGTGTQDITTVGFQPDIVLITSISATGTDVNPGGGNGQFMVGGMVDASQQGYCGIGARNGQATTATQRAGNVGAETGVAVTGAGAVTDRWSFNSMLVNGFRINRIESGTDRFFFMALKGGDYAIGQFNTATSLVTIPVTGLGFKPAGVFFSSVNNAETAVDTTASSAMMSLGAASGPSDQGVHQGQDEHNLATSVCKRTVEFDNVYLRLNLGTGGPTVVGAAALQSMDADGFTAVMTDAEPSPAPGAAMVMYWAFGPAAVEPIDQGVSGKWRYRRQQLPVMGQVQGGIQI